MSAEARAILPMLWLLACEDDDPKSGLIQKPVEAIAFRLRQKESVIKKVIDELESADFIECNESVTKPLQDRNETVTPETETETETETEDIVETTSRPGIPFSKIVSFLNNEASTNFRPTTDTTKRHIKARWNEGFTLDDFKSVISLKVDEWKTDEKMCKYIRPQTLFGTKFESYLQQARDNEQTTAKRKWNTQATTSSAHH